MSFSANDWFLNSLTALTEMGQQRVWSLIISLLGDLALRPGDRISGPALTRILDPMGIRPETKRVALHRLRNDGWILSEKQGRQSLYGLTESGYQQTVEATPRIYAQTERESGLWHAVVLPPRAIADPGEAEARLAKWGYVAVAQGVFVGTADAPTPLKDALVFTGSEGPMPDWITTSCGSDAAFQAYQSLETVLDGIAQSMPSAPALTPTETATLRTLIVHNWRRVLLSHPDLPPEFFPKGWRGFACRTKVMALLHKLERPHLQDIDRRVIKAS